LAEGQSGETMTIQVTGKNVETGNAYTAYICGRIGTVLGKYIGPDISGHVRLEKERSQFRTACSIRLRSGLVLEAHGEGGDAYSSADSALQHLEKRVRRHKRRLKSHHNGRDGINGASSASDYTLRIDLEDDEEDKISHPIIIAETQRGISEMPVSEAVMQLDVSESTFLLFRNASHGDLNVVYRRADGHIGWIDPSSGAGAGRAGNAEKARDQKQS
jgi:ribosomal subunit interface protein